MAEENEAEAEVEEGVEVEAEAPEPELDDDGNPVEPVVDEDEEVELDTDLKLKVPKAAAEKLREMKEGNLRQSDYSRKTAEVAELRKAAEAHLEAVGKASQEEIGALANVRALDFQIADYQKVDWEAHFEQNPLDAPRDWARYQGLVQSRGQSAAQYAHLKGQRESQEQLETAKRVEAGRAVLAKDIPEWSPQHAETLLKHGIDRYGFTREEIESFEDPRMVKVLHDAYVASKAQGTAKKVQTIAKAQEVKPAATVSARTAPPTGLSDSLSAEEWTKRRNRQLARA